MTQRQTPTSLASLPSEVLHHILAFLTPAVLGRVRRVSRSMCAAASDPSLYSRVRVPPAADAAAALDALLRASHVLAGVVSLDCSAAMQHTESGDGRPVNVISPEWLAALETHMPMLDELSVTGMIGPLTKEHSVALPRGLTALCLDRIVSHHVRPPLRPLSRLSSLECLSIRGLPWNPHRTVPVAALSCLRRLLLTTAAPDLPRLTLGLLDALAVAPCAATLEALDGIALCVSETASAEWWQDRLGRLPRLAYGTEGACCALNLDLFFIYFKTFFHALQGAWMLGGGV